MGLNNNNGHLWVQTGMIDPIGTKTCIIRDSVVGFALLPNFSKFVRLPGFGNYRKRHKFGNFELCVVVRLTAISNKFIVMLWCRSVLVQHSHILLLTESFCKILRPHYSLLALCPGAPCLSSIGTFPCRLSYLKHTQRNNPHSWLYGGLLFQV